MSEHPSNTREQILDVAQALIQRQGLNAMSFQDLSNSVGIRKASIHYYFSSKDEMVSAVLERYLKDFDKVVQKILLSKVTGKTKMKRYFALFSDTLSTSNNEKGCLCGMLAAEIFSLNEKGALLVEQFMKSNTAYLVQLLKTGVKDGSLQVSGDVKSMADLILASLEGGLLIARSDGGSKRFDTMSRCLLSMISNK